MATIQRVVFRNGLLGNEGDPLSIKRRRSKRRGIDHCSTLPDPRLATPRSTGENQSRTRRRDGGRLSTRNRTGPTEGVVYKEPQVNPFRPHSILDGGGLLRPDPLRARPRGWHLLHRGRPRSQGPRNAIPPFGRMTLARVTHPARSASEWVPSLLKTQHEAPASGFFPSTNLQRVGDFAIAPACQRSRIRGYRSTPSH